MICLNGQNEPDGYRHPRRTRNNIVMNCEHLKVAFAGTPEFAAVALDALLDSQHDVVAVLTQPDRPAGRGRKLSASAVKQRAEAAGVPVLQPVSLKTPEAQLAVRELNADVMVVAAYGLILPAEVLSIPPLGCLNIHASLLPRWRGAAPIHRAILAGDEQTGVCIMQMDRGLDTGDVLLEKRLTIGGDETSAQLHDRLASLGANALLEALPARCNGQLEPRVQPEVGVNYADKLAKSEAQLDFTQPADQLHRQVRAFNPWPVAESQLLGQRVRLWQSRLVTDASDARSLAHDSAPGTILSVDEESIVVRTGNSAIEFLTLQWPGKKPQSAADFARQRQLVGEKFQPLSESV